MYIHLVFLIGNVVILNINLCKVSISVVNLVVSVILVLLQKAWLISQIAFRIKAEKIWYLHILLIKIISTDKHYFVIFEA